MVKVKEIMKKFVITVDPEISVSDAAKIMTNNRIGSVVLLSKLKPVGIVTNDDIVSCVAKNLNLKKTKISSIEKRKKLITATPDDDIVKVTKLMIKSGVKRIPILKNGKLQGIVSEKDVLIVSPELIDILSERLKIRADRVARPDQVISGICEGCESYSDDLRNVGGRWYCESCREND
jgi:CBS domain-containing protein